MDNQCSCIAVLEDRVIDVSYVYAFRVHTRRTLRAKMSSQFLFDVNEFTVVDDFDFDDFDVII